jgi:hypothetical protein
LVFIGAGEWVQNTDLLISARTKSPLIDKAARAKAFYFFWNRISFLLALQFQWPNIYDLFRVFIILSVM